MGINSVPPATPKTRYITTLTSGTSWTVPAGVTYVNVTLRGGSGGTAYQTPGRAGGGQVIMSNTTVTPGGTATYAIGAGGTAGTGASADGGAGGTTTFTGATSATGGAGGVYGSTIGQAYAATANNSVDNSPYAKGTSAANGVVGGAGSIDVEYWA